MQTGQGPITIEVPRDRAGTFEPQLLHQEVLVLRYSSKWNVITPSTAPRISGSSWAWRER